MNSRILAVVIGMTLASTLAEAAPRASFTVRTIQGSTCVAPCAVHFDAIGNGALSATPYVTPETTDPSYSRPFHSLRYQWNFGDPTSGVWAHSGVSKDTDIGSIGGHVYANPGTYTVTLTVTNPAGESNATSRSVSVVAPATAFDAAHTFCFANSGGNWAGCPLDCTNDDNCTITNDFDLALTGGDQCVGTSDCANGDVNRVRVLLRRGDTFNNSSGLSLDLSDSATSPAMIEAFGSGANPVVGGDIDTGAGWTVTGLQINGGLSIGAFGDRPYNNATFYRLGVTTSGGCFNFPVDLGDPASKKLVAFVEIACLTRDVNWAGAHYLVFMGNTVDRQNIVAPSGNHYTWRSTQFQHLVFAHNFFTRNDPDGNHWQFRSSDSETSWSANEESNMYNLIHDNVMNLNAQTTAWMVRLCNDSGCNCINGTCSGPDFGEIVDVHDWIFERNLYRFENGAGRAQLDFFQLTGGDITIRNEILSFGNAIPSNQDLSLVTAIGETARVSGSTRHTNIHVYNNTIFASGSFPRTYSIANSNRGFGATGCTSGCLEGNNLVVFTNGAGSRLIDSPGFTSTSNRIDNDGTDPFEGTMQAPGTATRSSFLPATGESAVVDAGVRSAAITDRSVLDDARGFCRSDARPDIGALERGASPCPSSSQPPPPAALLPPTLLQP